MNHIIKTLIVADIGLLTAVGFVVPIFAIFITNTIQGGDIQVVGFAAAIYWIVKSSVTIPFGQYLDRNHGEKDDLYFVIVGGVIAAVSVFGYVFASQPWHVYVLQTFYAIGMGMNLPGYTAIFTRHIDRGREASDWSIRSSLMGFGVGISGALGGVLAKQFGFVPLFVGVGVVMVLGALIPIFLFKDISPRDRKVARVPKAKVMHPV